MVETMSRRNRDTTSIRMNPWADRRVPVEALGSVWCQWEYITPEIAAEYMALNVHNRRVRKQVVAMLVGQLLRGEYQVTHQGIAFDTEGALADGQHRLLAVIESRVTIIALVTRGLQPRARMAMDDHLKRSADDSIKLATGQEISAYDVAIVRMLHSLRAGEAQRLSRQTIADTHAHILQPLNFCRPTTSEAGTTSAVSRAAICAAWFYVPDLARLHKFDQIFLGKMMPNGSPDKAAQACRELVISKRLVVSGGQKMRLVGMKKIQRAIKAFCDYEYLTRLVEPDAPIYPYPPNLAAIRSSELPELPPALAPAPAAAPAPVSVPAPAPVSTDTQA